jgi:hypothetical protein
MNKQKTTDTSDAKAGGAKVPPADAAIVVTAARTLGRYLPPGTIIPHPTEREFALCSEGAAEPLAAWWPGLLQDEPQQADGRRYPVVLLRGGTELWVRLDARTLRPINDCSVNEAITALGRTADTATLGQAAQHARHPSVRQAARTLTPGGSARPVALSTEAGLQTSAAPADMEVRLAGEPQPVAIGFSGGRWPAVILDNGKEVKPAELYENQLLPLIASCEHKTVLQDLVKRDTRALVKQAAEARLKALATPPPPVDDSKTEDPPPPADPQADDTKTEVDPAATTGEPDPDKSRDDASAPSKGGKAK